MIGDIHEELLGTYEKPGLCRRFEAVEQRVANIEKMKEKRSEWISGITGGIVVGGILTLVAWIRGHFDS